MLAYYDEAVRNIDIANELSKPQPIFAQVKYSESHGIQSLIADIKFKKGDGSFTDNIADAVKPPYEALLTSKVEASWKSDMPTGKPKRDNAVHQLLESFLQSNIFSSRWKDDGINEPTGSCIDSALSLSMLIFEKFDILPVRIAPSIEEGVMVTYQKSSQKLLVEVYNTGEIAGLLRSGTNILKADDFEKQQDVLSLVAEYKNQLS